MSIFKKYVDYLKNNPEKYWFKRKLFGWGWTPVTWQGWLVVFLSIIIAISGIYIGEIDDAPGAALLGILIMFALLLGFGFWKGERPRWQWGWPEKLEQNKKRKKKICTARE